MPKLASHRQRRPGPATGPPTDSHPTTSAAAAPTPGPASAATPLQPITRLLGLAVVAIGFVLLGIVPGGPQTALETVGPIATFALPVLAASALWRAG